MKAIPLILLLLVAGCMPLSPEAHEASQRTMRHADEGIARAKRQIAEAKRLEKEREAQKLYQPQ